MSNPELTVWQARAPDSAVGQACRPAAWTGCLHGMPGWHAWEGSLAAAVILGGCNGRAGVTWVRKWSYDLHGVGTGQLCSCPGASSHHIRVHRAAPDGGSNFGLFLHRETECTGQSRAPSFSPVWWRDLCLAKPSSAKNPPQMSAPSPEQVSAFSSIPACPVSSPRLSLLWDLLSPGSAPKQLMERPETAKL